MTDDLYSSVGELVIDPKRATLRSRFVSSETHAKLIAACQVDLADKIASGDLDSALSLVPDRWIWERTDSVMWLVPFDVLTISLRNRPDKRSKILSVLEILLVDCLAENAFFGWDTVFEILKESTDPELTYRCLRVLRRHPMLNNPRKFSRQSPIVGSGTSNPLSVSLFVVDVNPSCKTWMEKRKNQLSSEKLSKEWLSGFCLKNTPDLSKSDFHTACFLQAVEMMILLVPRSLKTYMDHYPDLLSSLADWFKPSRLDTIRSNTLFVRSLCDCVTAILRETAYDETMAKLLGISGAPSDVGFSSTVKNILSRNFGFWNDQALFGFLGIYGARCQPIGGWTPQTIVTAFSPWLAYAINLLNSDEESPVDSTPVGRLHFAIVLTRLIGTVVDIGSPSFGTFFRDNGGFRITAKRLAVEVDSLVVSNKTFFSDFDSLSQYGEWHSRTVLVRGLMRLSELAFHALEGAGGAFGNNTHVNLHQAMGLIDGYFPSIKEIFIHPDSCSSGTVAITCSVLAQLIGHEPTSIVQLVSKGILESLVSAVSNPSIRASGECLSSITACFTAICVHSDGEKELERLGDPLNRIVIPTFFEPEFASIWLVPMKTLVMDKSDYSVGALVGTSCDELIRNRPSWRQKIVDSIISCLKTTIIDNTSVSFPDMLVSICKLIHHVCVNVDTSTAFIGSGGLIALMEFIDRTKSTPTNFTQAVPSHSIFRLFKQLTQQCFQIHSTALSSASASKNHVVFSWPEANVELAKKSIASLNGQESEMELVKSLSSLHLALHTAAVALKDTSPITSPKLVESLNPLLGILLVKMGAENVFQRVCRLACVYSTKDPKAKTDEEKELRRRLRDDRTCAESIWDVNGSKSQDDNMIEYVRGLWMVVRGFMCQVARVINYPNMSRQQSRRLQPQNGGGGVSPAARISAYHLAILAQNCLDIALEPNASPITANEAVDLLCRLHVEDKQHMTRTVCLDTFFKLGGVDSLLSLLNKACGNVEEYGEALQGILWWFERTTSLKRMHNAQITHLLERAGSTISNDSDSSVVRLVRFDAVRLVSSLQGEFARVFLPHWRSDDCVLKISAKASASLLKALTHVLEPNDRVFTTQLTVSGSTTAPPEIASQVASPPPTRLESQSPITDQRSGLIASLLRRGIGGGSIWRPSPGELSTDAAASRDEEFRSGALSTTDNASPAEELRNRSGNLLDDLIRNLANAATGGSSAITPPTLSEETTLIESLLDSTNIVLRDYMPYDEVLRNAKDVASDFMVRTIVLGSSEHTSAVAAQTHIADVCVRLSHNRILKLGSPGDEETVKMIQGIVDESAPRDRAGTMVVEDELMIEEDPSIPTQARIDTNLRTDTTSFEVDTAVATDGDNQPIVPTVDFSLYNTRLIANTCVEKFSILSQRRIACTILACILHARFDVVKDLLEDFPRTVLAALATNGGGDWLTTSLVCVEKLLRKQPTSNSHEFVSEIISTISGILQTDLDSAAAESVVRTAVSALASLNDPFVEREIVEQCSLLNRILSLPKKSAFEGIQSLVANVLQVYMRGRVLDLFSLWEIEQEVVAQLETRGNNGMSFSHVVEIAESVSEEYLTTKECKRTVLMKVLEGIVSFRINGESDRWDLDDPVKRRRTSGYEPLLSDTDDMPLNNRISIVLLPVGRRTRPLRTRPTTLPEFFTHNLNMLVSGFIASVHDLANCDEYPQALSPEDFLYLIDEYCRESQGRFFDKQSVKEILSSVKFADSNASVAEHILDQCTEVLINMISEKKNLTKTVLKLVNQLVSVLKKHSSENQIIQRVIGIIKSSPRMSCPGSVVIIHRVLTIGGSLKTEQLGAEIEWIKTRFMMQLRSLLDDPSSSTDLIEGLVDCVEIATRPPIADRGHRRARTPTPEPDQENEAEISMRMLEEAMQDMGGDAGGATIVTDGNGANIVAVQVVTQPNEANRGRALSMEGESILGGPTGETTLESSPSANETERLSLRPPRLAPIEGDEEMNEPRVPIRRMLSPFVPSDWGAQLPNWYNNRRSGSSTSGVGIVTADDFLPNVSADTDETSSFALFGIPSVGWSFDPSHTAEHPLISKSHTGSSSTAAAASAAPSAGAAASPLLGPSFAAPGQPPPPLNGPRDASDAELLHWLRNTLPTAPPVFHGLPPDPEDIMEMYLEEMGRAAHYRDLRERQAAMPEEHVAGLDDGDEDEDDEDEDDEEDDEEDEDEEEDEDDLYDIHGMYEANPHLMFAGEDDVPHDWPQMAYLDEASPVSDVLMGSPALPPEMVPAQERVPPVPAVSVSGIAAIEQAARRFNMPESDFLSLTGLDPSVIRDLPEDMHAEIIREFIAGLAPEIRGQLNADSQPSLEPADNATFLATITQPEIRNEILLTANEEFLASLPPDLHAEAVLLRERLSRRGRRLANPPRRPPPIEPAPTAAVQQSMTTAIRSITDLFQRALEGEEGPNGTQVTVQPMGGNMATVNVVGPSDSVGVNELLNLLAGGNNNLRFGRLLNRYRDDQNSRNPSNVNHSLPRLSTVTVNKVCEYYDSQTGSILHPSDIDTILKIFDRLDTSNTTRVVAENLLFNLALSRCLRSEIVSRIVLKLSENSASITARNRLVSLSHFLVNQIPFVMDCIASDPSLTNNLVQSVLRTSPQPVHWELVHHLFVPIQEDRPSTTRHRISGHSDSVVDKLISNLSDESVRLIIKSIGAFASLSPSFDPPLPHAILLSLSQSSPTKQALILSEISLALSELGMRLTGELGAGKLAHTDTTTDEERLCELVKIRRKCFSGNSTTPSPLDALWFALDKELAQYDSIHASEEPASALPSPSGSGGPPTTTTDQRPLVVHHGVRRLFYLIEAFVVEHTVAESSAVTTGGLARSLSQAAGLSSVPSTLVAFADKHRRPLNGLIRESPELLFSSFSPLVTECPWVLDFDNKRKYFRRKLKSISDQSLAANSIRLSVRRSEVFMDSFYQLRHRTAVEMRGKLSVQFTGEEGVDAGGLVREWFGILSREIFNPNYALFKTAGGKASTFYPNPTSFVNPDHLSFFEFCGRVMGKALFDDQRLDAYFTRSFYKHMLGSPVTWMDFEVEDPDYYKQLMWILDNDLNSPEAATVVEHLTFTTDVDEFGKIQTVELVPGGASMAVTEENKKEFVRSVCEYKMTTSITPQVNAFMKGFHELIPAQLIGQLFDDKELELLISGLPTINLADLRANTDYVNYTASSDQIQWFWRVLENDFSQEQLAWFLQFVTGSAQVPLEGFKVLVGMRGPQKFSIHKAYGSERLPTAHTCFNQLDLPEYTSEEVLREKLLKAVTEAHEGFGFI